MKFVFLIIFSIPSTVYAQTVTIKEIKRKANSGYINISDITIIYPIILTKNQHINKLINHEIRDEILGSNEEKESLNKDLNDLINDGLTDLSYIITFNKNDLLSLSIYTQESGGNHLTSSEAYFNFDIKTGKNLKISDLIDDNKIDSFKKKVFEDKITFLKKYKEEKKRDLDKNEIDSTTYTWTIEQVDSNCINVVQIENFSLLAHNIEIIDPCEFPQIIRSQQPTNELKYSYKFLDLFLKSEFKHRLLE